MHNKTKVNLLFLLLLSTTIWAVLAVYYGDSGTDWVQIGVAGLIGLTGLTALVSLIFNKWRNAVLSVYALVFIAVFTWWFAIEPSNDRAWQQDVALLPYATIAGDAVTVHNVRKFDYRSEFDYIPAYYDQTYNLNELAGMDLYAVYWMGPAIAHTILSFNFGNNRHLAISIEARKELGEGYSAIKGFFRQYELTYIVADERDIIRLRTHFRHNPPEAVYLYPLRAKTENIRRLFLEYIRKMNKLRQHPAFYNILLDNCTTNIWFNTHVNPDHLPFSWKILVSGYVPEFLYESNALDNRISFEEWQRLAYINPVALTLPPSADFSHEIRVPFAGLNVN
ncbi:hypothetical protein MCAMS1_02519 [biofilm metagenome]